MSRWSVAYHHGDLPAALLEAVDRAVGECGVTGVSLRDVARRAGVSHGAPAYHFGSKADLVRAIDVPVVCSFIKPSYKQSKQGESPLLEILFSHELAIADKHVLLVEGLVHSGVTTEFLMNDLRGRGAASVKLVTLLDRQSARRVPLQPDYFGFLVDDAFLCGYGLGSPEQTGRNLPYVAAAT